MPITAQTVTIVQHQPQQFVTHHVQQASPPKIYRLPEAVKTKSYHLGISILVHGLICLLWGCIGYAITNFRLFILSTGINIICGVLVSRKSKYNNSDSSFFSINSYWFNTTFRSRKLPSFCLYSVASYFFSKIEIFYE